MEVVDGHDWIEPYIERVVEFLGLQAWTWDLNVIPNLTNQHGARTDGADATCSADWRYLDAVITIDSHIWHTKMCDPERRGAAKILLCHEVCHMLMAQTAHGMEQLVNIYFPPEDETPSDKSTAFTVYQDHEEHVVTRLSRQVYEALKRDAQLDLLKQLVRDIDSQLTRPTDDPDAPEAITGYQIEPGYWHNVIALARD